jgi:1-acyl-sn-glycerol-3-phosphate acyltransferase
MNHDPDANEWVEPYRRVLAYYSVVASIPLVVMGVVVLFYGIGSWQSWPLLDAFWFQSFTKWYFFALATTLCVWCWLRLFRPCFELCCESFFWFPYAVRVSGPGVTQIPPVGPLLVISNHASWFDPLFLAKFIPRPITPMMTESFYKLWFLRPILKHVFHVIVVRESVVRREAPELQQAIEALARGECVVLFPEGYLRRKVDVELRRFAQGVWRILLAAPNTPVMACWIEGAWGTKYSWRNGPPGKNKHMDFRTLIRVGFTSPEIVPAQVMSDSMATRIYLMNQVSNARTHVELEPLAQFETTPLVERKLQTTQDEELT